MTPDRKEEEATHEDTVYPMGKHREEGPGGCLSQRGAPPSTTMH